MEFGFCGITEMTLPVNFLEEMEHKMKSKLYRKFRASKYVHKTHIIAGSGNAKGKLVIGHKSALAEINQKRAEKKLPSIVVHHIEKNAGQWIFCEKKGGIAK